MSGIVTTVEYAGKTRHVVGPLHYPRGCEPAAGALVGPNAWGETCVVLGHEAEGDRVVTLIGRAIVGDVEAAGPRMDEPQTLAEVRTRIMTQQVPDIFRAVTFRGPK